MPNIQTWDKRKLHKILLEALRAELEAILLAAGAAKEGATHEDAVAKSKYDTHGLELSYLAGSQFERARLAESKILVLENTPFPAFHEDDAIDSGALVSVRDTQKKADQIYLLSSIGAGLSLRYEGIDVVVISPESPLGESLVSLGVADIITSKSRKQSSYEIIAIA